MNPRGLIRKWALLLALMLGLLADALVRTEGRPGLGLALWATAGVAVLILLLRRRPEPPSHETCGLIASALAFALALTFRDSEALALFSLLASVALLGLAGGRAGAAWAGRAHVSAVLVAAIRHLLLCAAGPLGWGRAISDSPPQGRRWILTLVRGTLMALPVLVVLTALLMSADPVFDRLIREALLIDIEILLEHVVFIGVLAWVISGYLRAVLVHDAVTDRIRIWQPAVPAAEIVVSLWILNTLFIVFLGVQLRYLFGGADLIAVTPGLSYAEYARRGFFELVAASALVVPILLLADWMAAPDPPRAHRAMRSTMIVVVVLLVGVIASASYRMWLYQAAYGLTEQRMYVSAFILWLTAVLGWLTVTVLRGQRERFFFGAIVAGMVCLALLHVMNPHATIARVNIDRLSRGAEYDGRYLGTLSADAVPALVERLDRLPHEERCRVSRMLEDRWSGERTGGWRTWNAGDWRARQIVRAGDAEHRRYLATCAPPAGAEEIR